MDITLGFGTLRFHGSRRYREFAVLRQEVYEFLVLDAVGELFVCTDKFILLSRQHAEGKKLRNSSYLQKEARYIRSLIPRILGYAYPQSRRSLCP